MAGSLHTHILLLFSQPLYYSIARCVLLTVAMYNLAVAISLNNTWLLHGMAGCTILFSCYILAGYTFAYTIVAIQ